MMRRVVSSMVACLLVWAIVAGAASAGEIENFSGGKFLERLKEIHLEYSKAEGECPPEVVSVSGQAEGSNWERVVGDGFGTTDMFGNLRNDYAWAMSAYTDPQGDEWLYVGTLYVAIPPAMPGRAEVWRSATGDQGSSEWERVRVFEGCSGVRGMTIYAGLLWVGTLNPNGCELWVTDGEKWELANLPGFGVNAQSTRGISAYRGELYADAGQKSDDTSAEVFKYAGPVIEDDLNSINPASWQSVASDGSVWIDPVNSIGVMKEFQGDLYVGTWSRGMAGGIGSDLGCDVYRYQGEEDVWQRVASNGFGNPNNASILSGAVFNDYFYVGTAALGFFAGDVFNLDGADVWRTSNGEDWEPVTTNGNLRGTEDRFDNMYIWSMTVFEDYLLIGTWNFIVGCEVWASKTGNPNSFIQINQDGMEPGRDKVEIVYDSQTIIKLNEMYGARSFATFQDQLYVGIATWALHADWIFSALLGQFGAGIKDFPHSFNVGCEVWRLDHLLPVVTGLRATPADGRVDLYWSQYTEPDFDLAGYNVYRRANSGSGYEEIAHLVGTNRYADPDVTNGVTYYYAVTAENAQGIETYYSDEVAVIPGIPGETFWLYPNPFQPNDYNANTGTWEEGITFELINYPGVHKVKIYTLTGELIVETQDTDWIDEGGRLIWQWKARNENGDKVASGLYFYLVACGMGEQRSGKIVVIK